MISIAGNLFIKKITVIFIIGLILRAGYVLLAPQIEVYRGDSAAYATISRNLFERGSFSIENGKPDVYWAPGYPFFILAVYKIFGYGFTALRLAQSVLSALVIILVYCTASRIFGRQTGLLSAVITCLYPGFIGYSGIFASQLLAMFLITLFIFLIVKFRMSVYLAVILGIIAGYSSLVRAELMLFWPALFLIMLLTAKTKNQAIKWLGVSFAAMCLVVSLWSIRNYKTFGKIIPISVKYGDTLWVSTWKEEWLEWYDREPHRSIVKGRSQAEAANAHLKAAIDNLKEHPFIYLKMCLKRLYRLWLTSNSNIFYFMKYSFLDYLKNKQYIIFIIKLIMLIFNMSIVLLGFLGIRTAFLKLKENRSMLYYICVPILFISVLHFFTFATPRYTIPIMPLVIIFASYKIIDYKAGRLSSIKKAKISK